MKFRHSGAAPASLSEMVMCGLEGLERAGNGWRDRARGAAARWALRAFPRLAGSVLEVAAAGFAPAPLPHFYSTDVREIDPTLNDDLLELYGRAGQILANRFAFFNSPQAFEEGINWEPAQSPGWRAELHAFDYALELACTFRISGEEIYARHLRYLLAHWIASNPPGCGSGWKAPVVGRRLRNWMLAADFARRDWVRDAEFQSLVASSVAQQTTFLASQLSSLLTATACLDASRALLCASRFFAGSQAREARRLGFDLLTGELSRSPAEPWPLARLARAQALMEWILLSPPGESDLLTEKLHDALDELQAVLMPDGSMPLLGPGARLAHHDLADLAALAAVTLASPAWKSLAGNCGIIPYLLLGESGKKRFESLEDVEWAAEDQLDEGSQIARLAGPRGSGLVVSAHLPGSPGEHQDFTSYELNLQGQRLVVDSGGFRPEEVQYFPRPRAHNILMVDGFEPRWDGAEPPANLQWESSPHWVRLRMIDPGFEFLGVRHERAWFRLEDDAWVILDWLRGRGMHSVTVLTHFYPTFDVVAGADRVVLRSRARRFALIPLGYVIPRPAVSRGEHPILPGWYSPEFGVKFPSAVLALSWDQVELPWLGASLITPAEHEPFRRLETHPVEGLVRFEFSGKTYELPMK